MNSLRIPVGYWAYDRFDSPYHAGADTWMEKAIDWARAADMKVLVDLHGAPGGQNGFDNSGRAGVIDWQQPQNLLRTDDVLLKMTRKYGSKRYSDVVFGIQLINEPISWGANNFETTKAWATNITQRLLSISENKSLKIIMHDAFREPEDWLDTHKIINRDTSKVADARFGLDTHLYQVFVDEDKKLSQDQHVQKACQWRSRLRKAREVAFPIYVGEWATVTDMCLLPNGTTTAGMCS